QFAFENLPDAIQDFAGSRRSAFFIKGLENWLAEFLLRSAFSRWPSLSFLLPRISDLHLENSPKHAVRRVLKRMCPILKGSPHVVVNPYLSHSLLPYIG